MTNVHFMTNFTLKRMYFQLKFIFCEKKTLKSFSIKWKSHDLTTKSWIQLIIAETEICNLWWSNLKKNQNSWKF